MGEMTVLIDKDDNGTAVITLNRPAAMNAMSRQLRRELTEAIDNLAQDPGIRVLILTGAGRAFCSGLDLKELGSAGAQALGSAAAVNLGIGGGASGDGVAAASSDPLQAMNRFKGPIIGAINGAAITGGFEIALACDVLLASTAARFADTHARVGVMPGWGLSQKLSRVIGPYRAKELSLTGNFLSAGQAAHWGLVNRVVAPDQLMPVARQLASDMLSVVPDMLVNYKRVINDGYALSLGDGLRVEGERARAANTTVQARDVEQRRAGIRARGKAQSGG
jgi:enoyl-CoA hydratase